MKLVEVKRGESEGNLRQRSTDSPGLKSFKSHRLSVLYITRKIIRLFRFKSEGAVVIKGCSENVLENVTQNLKGKSWEWGHEVDF